MEQHQVLAVNLKIYGRGSPEHAAFINTQGRHQATVDFIRRRRRELNRPLQEINSL
jgi:hypothetical protein